jgi:hypothetical protein
VVFAPLNLADLGIREGAAQATPPLSSDYKYRPSPLCSSFLPLRPFDFSLAQALFLARPDSCAAQPVPHRIPQTFIGRSASPQLQTCNGFSSCDAAPWLHDAPLLVIMVGGMDVRYSLAIGEDIRALLKFRTSSA